MATEWMVPYSTGRSRPSGQGSSRCRPGPEHGHRRAEALVDAALPEIDELQARQDPAQQRGAENRRQDGGAQELQGPAARKIQPEMSAQQVARGARTAGDRAEASRLSVTAVASAGAGAGRNMRASARIGQLGGDQLPARRSAPAAGQRTHASSAPRPSSMSAAATSSSVVSSNTRRNAGASGSCGAGKAFMTRSATSDTNASAKTKAAARLAVVAAPDTTAPRPSTPPGPRAASPWATQT